MIEFEFEMANAFESFGQDMDVAHFPSMDGTLQIKLGDKVTYVNCQKKKKKTYVNCQNVMCGAKPLPFLLHL